MQEYTVALTKTAEDNLANIAAYIEELDSSYSALRVVKKIRRQIATLRFFPERKLVEGYSKPIWMVHTGKYNIFYRIDKKRKTVKVFRILLASQDYTRHLGKRQLTQFAQ